MMANQNQQKVPDLVPINGSTNVYVGQRYVPKFYDDGTEQHGATWDKTKVYEPLTIVLWEGDSYTSRTFVPAGVEITDTQYWLQTGIFNAQLESYKEEVEAVADNIKKIKTVNGVDIYYPKSGDSFNLAQGMCLIVDTDTTILMDFGYSECWPENNAFLSTLMRNGVFDNIDYFILSHYHIDHVSCLKNILDTYPHKNAKAYVPMSPEGYLSSALDEYNNVIHNYNTVMSNFSDAGVPVTVVNSVLKVSYQQNRTITFYNSTPAAYTYYSANSNQLYNNFCMITLIELINAKMLFPGDLQKVGEQYAYENYDIKDVNFMQINHHGIQSDDYDQFVFKVCPKVMVLQTNNRNLKNGATGSKFDRYTENPIYSTERGSVGVHVGENGFFGFDGYEIKTCGTAYSYFDVYVDNSRTTDGDGSKDNPFNNLMSALQIIPKTNNNSYAIHLKPTNTPYPGLYLRGFNHPILVDSWDETTKYDIAYIDVSGCMDVRLYRANIVGHNVTNDGDSALCLNHTMTYAYDISVNCNNHAGILINQGILYIGNSTITCDVSNRNTGIAATRWGIVIPTDLTFTNVLNAYSTSRLIVCLGGVDTLNNVQTYFTDGSSGNPMPILFGGAGGVRHKANMAKNNPKVISSMFVENGKPHVYIGANDVELSTVQ